MPPIVCSLVTIVGVGKKRISIAILQVCTPEQKQFLSSIYIQMLSKNYPLKENIAMYAYSEVESIVLTKVFWKTVVCLEAMLDNLLGLQVKTFKKCLHIKRRFINCSAKLMTFWHSVEGEMERKFGKKRKKSRLAVLHGDGSFIMSPSPYASPLPVSQNNCCEQLSCGNW